MNLQQRTEELRGQGLSCSQTVVALVALEARGVENPELLQAARGLGYGMYAQLTCGSLSGGTLGLAAYENDRPKVKEMCLELTAWFQERFGCTTCMDMIGEGEKAKEICNISICETAEKCLQILQDRGYCTAE